VSIFKTIFRGKRPETLNALTVMLYSTHVGNHMEILKKCREHKTLRQHNVNICCLPDLFLLIQRSLPPVNNHPDIRAQYFPARSTTQTSKTNFWSVLCTSEATFVSYA
jgi:hypothetical protein